MVCVTTDADLRNKVNDLRSRMVEFYFKKETVWKNEEWLDPNEFNSIIVDMILDGAVTFKEKEEVVQYKLSEGVEL